MDDKDVNSYVDELMAKGMDKKLSGMLGDPDEDFLDAVPAARDSLLPVKAEEPPINNTVEMSANSNHVEQTPSIIVHNSVSYAPPHHPELTYPHHTSKPSLAPEFKPGSSISAGQRETDQLLTGPQCDELRESLEQVMTLAKLLKADIIKSKLWTGVSDYCDVPTNIPSPRFKSISQNDFHKAIYFFNKKKCELLILQLETSREEETKAKRELSTCLDSIGIAETEAVVIANEDLQQSNKELLELKQELDATKQAWQLDLQDKKLLEQENQQVRLETKQHERALYALIASVSITAVILGLGWFGYF